MNCLMITSLPMEVCAENMAYVRLGQLFVFSFFKRYEIKSNEKIFPTFSIVAVGMGSSSLSCLAQRNDRENISVRCTYCFFSLSLTDFIWEEQLLTKYSALQVRHNSCQIYESKKDREREKTRFENVLLCVFMEQLYFASILESQSL